MNQDIKNIIIFYFILFVSMIISAFGIYLLTEIVGKIYAGFVIFFIPLLMVYHIATKLSELKSKEVQ